MTIYFTDFAAFLGMNGYAAYVWPAWALVLGLLATQAFSVRAERARALGELRRRMRRERAQSMRGDEPPAHAVFGEERVER
ncbi:heme exporter protein CcmD [Halotalea alkalilenta]|uniref:heme exporter protein CcmD n=1 Tax=Halotalea alkalilenta TaxID=376489 RepID=UPI0009E041D3|nr:heme exporter protein CcmD [Halotalea alkalilenta]